MHGYSSDAMFSFGFFDVADVADVVDVAATAVERNEIILNK